MSGLNQQPPGNFIRKHFDKTSISVVPCVLLDTWRNGYSLKLVLGYGEEDRRADWSKFCEYNNKDEENSLNILKDKKETLSQNFNK